MQEIKLFYSWQSDKKDASKILEAALRTAKDKLKKEGISLHIDKDTRDVGGSPEIREEILNKIENADLFLADVTPVNRRHEKAKRDLIPNPCVMYELGYASRAIGVHRTLMLAKFGEDESREQMPFDIEGRRISEFKDENSLKDLHLWIKSAMEHESRKEADSLKQRNCTVTFGDGADTVILSPKYAQVSYIEPYLPQEDGHPLVAEQENLDVILGGNPVGAVLKSMEWVKPVSFNVTPNRSRDYDRSCCKVEFAILNLGNEAMENCKVSINLKEDNEIKFTEKDFEDNGSFITSIKLPTSYSIEEKEVFRLYATVNPKESLKVCEAFIVIPPETKDFNMEWEVSCKTFNRKGELHVTVVPLVENIMLESAAKAGEVEIKPFIEKVPLK